MDSERMKKAAQWFYQTVFQKEVIRATRPRPEPPRGTRLPPLLRTARSLADQGEHRWQTRESVFYKQAKLLAAFEDDFPYDRPVTRYYPTYQSLDDPELRAYFTWRTRLRRGEVKKTSLTYAFLYIYELINGIGITDAMDGYRKLSDFRERYGRLDDTILPYLTRWMLHYVVYYDLDRSLLPEQPQAASGRSVDVLAHIHESSREEVIQAVHHLAPKWLERSRFYRDCREDMDQVIYRVLCKISDRCAARCKRSFAEQYFGSPAPQDIWMFESAVFCDPLKRRSFTYQIEPWQVYQCRNGFWTVTGYSSASSRKLLDLIKAIDGIMREEYGYKKPIQYTIDTKWLAALIRQEVKALQAEKQTAQKKEITINFSQLDAIRSQAAITQEKLTVDEDLEELEPEPELKLEPEQLQPKAAAPEAETSIPGTPPLSAPEYKLLRCLLYGMDLGWIHGEGHILSVLSDGINDKLYDMFQDSVMDDTPELIPDYIDDLKEMIPL